MSKFLNKITKILENDFEIFFYGSLFFYFVIEFYI